MSIKQSCFIVAGNYNEYASWMKSTRPQTLFGATAPKCVYVSSADMLRGLSEINGYYIGTYMLRPDIETIKTFIAIIKGRHLP